MSTPILATKLYIPPPRPNVVRRPHLIERLNQGLRQNQGGRRKLTLISAPAGFGKTTLISKWVNQKDEGKGGPDEKNETHPFDFAQDRPSAFILHPSRVAWLSLDEGDNDPTRFLTYLVAALQMIESTIGEGVLTALQSPQPPASQSILTALVNEITTIPNDFVLVLDDYHVIEAKPVNEALSFLLQHLPPQMHLVIATRQDPPLPLARYRARRQMTELRAADLRFTPAEAAAFLNQVMDLDLSPEDVAALESRTEGWIAGLQLAALALQGQGSWPGHQDATRFIQSFTGSHRFVLDYLVEEVLQQQPESVQTFLLCTAILDRLCGPLCDTVLGKEEDRRWKSEKDSSSFVLEYLEQANLFIVPLDSERRWYRYHHLFADVLQARLMKEQPNQVAGLHLRACRWYEQNNFRSDAIRHALAAEDFERAADLIELEWSANSGTYFQSATWLGWVKALPDEIVRTRPRLSIGFAWELLFLGELEAAEARMRDADRLLELTADIDDLSETLSTHTVVVDEEEFRPLRASLAIARAFHAQALDDVASTEKHARRALTLVSEADYHTRGLASALLGLARLTNGDLEAAHKYVADGMASLQMAGNLLFATSGTYVLADIRIAQGRLFDAVNTYEQALQLVTAQGEPLLQGTADLHLGLSMLFRQQGNVGATKRHLMRSQQLGERAALPEWPAPLYLVRARVKEDQGDLDGALELLDEAERLYYRGPVPNLRPVAALKARVWIKQGRLTEALSWAQRRGLSVDDDLSYLREFEHVTLARLLIARCKSERTETSIHEATALLERLLKAAEEGGRTGSVIEILVLQALAHETQGDIALALAPLERALALAEPESYVRIFVDEGSPMAALLRETTKHSIAPNYVRQLLTAFGEAEGKRPVTESLIEPLTARELEVLQLLGTELNGPEIARELTVSLNTMRTHTKNIYKKLEVHSRRAAVRRAEELDLL